MKSILAFLITAVIVFSSTTAGITQVASTGGKTNTPTGGMATDGNRTAVADKKIEPTGNEMTYTGQIVSLNTADLTMVVKGKEGNRTFDISNAATSGSVTTGHTVHVTYYTDEKGKMVASRINGSMKIPRKGY